MIEAQTTASEEQFLAYRLIAEEVRACLRAGHEVCTAGDGPSSLAAAATFRPEVVLLDIGLPGLSGYDVARQMRTMPEVCSAMLVAQTGWGQDEDRRRSREAGFNDHLVKPVSLTDLQRLLAALPPNGSR